MRSESRPGRQLGQATPAGLEEEGALEAGWLQEPGQEALPAASELEAS